MSYFQLISLHKQQPSVWKESFYIPFPLFTVDDDACNFSIDDTNSLVKLLHNKVILLVWSFTDNGWDESEDWNTEHRRPIFSLLFCPESGEGQNTAFLDGMCEAALPWVSLLAVLS